MNYFYFFKNFSIFFLEREGLTPLSRVAYLHAIELVVLS